MQDINPDRVVKIQKATAPSDPEARLLYRDLASFLVHANVYASENKKTKFSPQTLELLYARAKADRPGTLSDIPEQQQRLGGTEPMNCRTKNKITYFEHYFDSLEAAITGFSDPGTLEELFDKVDANASPANMVSLAEQGCAISAKLSIDVLNAKLHKHQFYDPVGDDIKM